MNLRQIIGRQRLSWLVRGGIGCILLVMLLSLIEPENTTLLAAAVNGDYGTMLSFYPGNSALWDRWIKASAQQNPATAARLLQRLAAIAPDGWTIARRRQYADLMAAQGDGSSAYRLRHALLADLPQDVALWRQVSTADIARHNWPEAIADFGHLATLVPTDGETLYTLGLLSALDKPDQAIRFLGQAALSTAVHDKALGASQLLSRLSHGPALTQIGLDLAAQGSWVLADYFLARASALNSQDMVALAMYGVAQEQQGHPDEGWLLIQEAAIRSPSDPVVNYALAAHWQRRGDCDAALAVLNAAEARDAKNPALAEQIGLIYEQRGATDPAAHWLILAVQLAPNNADFAQALAELYADQNYVLDNGGLTFIQFAAKQFPANGEIHASLGAALLATGQTNAAIPELKQAVLLAPGSARAGYYLGLALERIGDVPGAAQAYLTATAPGELTSGDSSGIAFRQLAIRALARLSLSG